MKSVAVIARKQEAGEIMRYLKREGYLNENIKTEKTGDSIVIPLIRKPEDSPLHIIEYDFQNFYENNVKSRIYEEALKKGVDPEDIPEKWVRYGKAMIVRKPVSKTVFDIMKDQIGIESLYYYDHVRGEYRQPLVIHQYGKRGEIKHRENGLSYVFDPEKIMFSPGNVNERTAMRNYNLPGKKVLDMFSGIGYFSLPLAKYGNPDIIYACDINRDAILYLKKNSSINHVSEKIRAIHGDSRVSCPHGVFDLIVMGNFKSIDYLPHALIRSGPGTEIILHYLVSEENIKKHTYAIQAKVKNFGFSSTVLDSHIVKSYAPDIVHVSTKIKII